MAGRNILVALDFTDESMHTIKWALNQHAREGDTVTLLHVQPEHTPAAYALPGPGPFAALHEREQEQLHARQLHEKHVSDNIHAWVLRSCPPGVRLSWQTSQISPASVAVSGDGPAARRCILSEASCLKADCLILGSHRAHADSPLGLPSTSSGSAAPGSSSLGSSMAALGWRSLSLGSAVPTSEYCAQHAPCPVIVVPPTAPPAVPVPCSAAAAAVAVPSEPSAFLDSLAL